MKITLYVDDSNDDREAPKKLALRLLTSAFDLDAGETVLDRFYHLVTKYGLQRLVAEEFAVRAIREEDEIEVITAAWAQVMTLLIGLVWKTMSAGWHFAGFSWLGALIAVLALPFIVSSD